jgi:hypothetical protein
MFANMTTQHLNNGDLPPILDGHYQSKGNPGMSEIVRVTF